MLRQIDAQGQIREQSITISKLEKQLHEVGSERDQLKQAEASQQQDIIRLTSQVGGRDALLSMLSQPLPCFS